MDKYISKIKTPRVSIAPMIDKTVKHFRYFCRIITKKSLLYTEMISTYAIKYGDRKKILDFDPFEKPLALQIAGSDPKEVYEAVKIAEDWDYDEINLNVGCPSNKVSGHCMGAVLMAYPELVAEMVSSIKKATEKPVTVKHRIGIDGKNILPESFNKAIFDRYEDMENFIGIVSSAGVDRFTIHARIAILAGLNPKENRDIPPLRYEDVYKLKENYSNLNIEINGGIKTISEIEKHLKHVDGVMIGRIAYKDPFILSKVDKVFDDGKIHNITRMEIIERMISYIEKIEDRGNWQGYSALQHMFGLFHDKRGSKEWRNIITPPWPNGYTAKDILAKALKTLPQEILNETPINK